MLEFLIQRVDGDWFDIPSDIYRDILRPTSIPSRPLENRQVHYLEVDGCEISFSFEEPGIQVVFESGDMPEEKAEQIVAEVCANIELSTGQKGKVIQLSR